MPKIGPVHWKEFERFLIKQECFFKRERGDHRIYWKEGLSRPIIIPRNKSLPPFIINNNLRTLGVDKATFVAFLEGKKKK